MINNADEIFVNITNDAVRIEFDEVNQIAFALPQRKARYKITISKAFPIGFLYETEKIDNNTIELEQAVKDLQYQITILQSEVYGSETKK